MKKSFLLTFGIIFGFLPVFSSLAFADQVHLLNGDRISGTILNRSANAIKIEATGMGVINIDKSVIEKALTDAEIAEIKMIEAAKEAQGEKNWSGEIEGGFDRKRGNTKSTELHTAGKFEFKTAHFDLLAKGKLFYSEEDRKMNAQKYDGTLRFDRRFGKKKKWFGFGEGKAERDRFANIDARLIPSVGLGYWFAKSKDFTLKTEVGLGFEHTRFRDDQTSNTTDLVLVPRLFIEKVIIGETKISEDLVVYPNLNETGEYRYVSETTLDNPITKAVSLQFKLINEYNSMPGEDTKKNDMRIISGLKYKF